jgi:hypothetical protein
MVAVAEHNTNHGHFAPLNTGFLVKKSQAPRPAYKGSNKKVIYSLRARE